MFLVWFGVLFALIVLILFASDSISLSLFLYLCYSVLGCVCISCRRCRFYDYYSIRDLEGLRAYMYPLYNTYYYYFYQRMKHECEKCVLLFTNVKQATHFFFPLAIAPLLFYSLSLFTPLLLLHKSSSFFSKHLHLVISTSTACTKQYLHWKCWNTMDWLFYLWIFTGCRYNGKAWAST